MVNNDATHHANPEKINTLTQPAKLKMLPENLKAKSYLILTPDILTSR